MDMAKIVGFVVGSLLALVGIAFVTSWFDAWVWNSLDFLEEVYHLKWHEAFRAKLLLGGVAGLFSFRIKHS